jgi:hypothetical protein
MNKSILTENGNIFENSIFYLLQDDYTYYIYTYINKYTLLRIPATMYLG